MAWPNTFERGHMAEKMFLQGELESIAAALGKYVFTGSESLFGFTAATAEPAVPVAA